MNIPLLSLFNIKKETGSADSPNLTEERIYSYSHYFLNIDKRIPVLSAATADDGVVGYVPDLRTENQREEHKSGERLTANEINYYKNNPEGCITIVADGIYAGYSFYRTQKSYPIFAANISCLILYKKPDSEVKENNPNYDGLNVEWFNLKFHNLLLNVVRGEGVKHFTETVCENIDNLDIPPLKEQEREIVYLTRLDNVNRGFHKVKEHIELTLSKEVNGFKAIVNDDFKNIFSVSKGTGGFTEEAIYHAMPTEGCEQVPVYGGEESHNTPRKYVWEKAENKQHKPVKYFDGECLILSMDGSAGHMTYKQEEKFTLNHHAACVTLKKAYLGRINLKWFKHEYQNTLIEAAVSKKSSRTLSKEVLNSLVITAPDIITQEKWVEEIEELELLNSKLQNIQDDIDELSQVEVISL